VAANPGRNDLPVEQLTIAIMKRAAEIRAASHMSDLHRIRTPRTPDVFGILPGHL
jgi:hypothetical protein